MDVLIILFTSLLQAMMTSFLVVITYDVEKFQLMINEGISELLFISDNVWQMEKSFYPDLPGGEKENMNPSNVSVICALS